MIFNQTLPAQGGGGTLRDVSAEFWALNSDAHVNFISAVVDEGSNIAHVYAELVDLQNFSPFYVPNQYAVDIAQYVDEMMPCMLTDGATLDVGYWDNANGCFAIDAVYTEFYGSVRLFASWIYVN